MNLLKKNPFSALQLVLAFITVAVVIIFVYFFTYDDLRKLFFKTVPEPKLTQEVPKEGMVFGVIHVALDSPSYAKSNFDVNPATKIALYYNEEVDLKSLIEKIDVTNQQTNEDVLFSVDILEREDDFQGDYLWKWQETWKQQVVLSPKNELATDTTYKISIKNGVKSLDESIATNHDYEYTFTTTGVPNVLNTSFTEEGIRVSFASPMNTKELEEKVTIKPEVENVLFNNNDKELIVSGDFADNVDYEIYIPGNTKDIYERGLVSDYTAVLELR